MLEIHARAIRWRQALLDFATAESGQGLVEYAMIISVVAIMIVGALVAYREALIPEITSPVANLMNHG